ncbi:MAG: LysM peptidoglycan-binding domain-containing protein [Verrucomicrobiota bacterium]
MRIPRIFFCFLVVILSGPFAGADGLHNLVKPNLDEIREAAEAERQKELARLEQLRLEEEAKRLEEEERQRVIAAMKADPMVDVETLKLVSEREGKDSYKIESGQTLGWIASDRYGSSQYYPIIELWNGVKATKVYVGQTVKTPNVSTIVKVKGKKVLSRYPDEMLEMIKLREEYLNFHDELYAAAGGGMTEEVKTKLGEFYDRAKKIHGGFLVKRPGVKEYATGLLSQCKNLVDQFAAMKRGEFGKRNSRIVRVHTCLANAMRNAIYWGEEDFK